MRDLKVNKTQLTSRYPFIVNIPGLGFKEEQKITIFPESPWTFEVSRKPWLPNDAYIPFFRLLRY